MRRINFAADLVGDVGRPGVSYMIDSLKAQGEASPEGFVNTCLDLMGPLDVDDETREELVGHAGSSGPLRWGSQQDAGASTERVAEMLQLIVSLRDYQYA